MVKGLVDERYITPVEKGMQSLCDVIEIFKTHLSTGKIMQLIMSTTDFQQAISMMALACLHLWSLTISQSEMSKILGDAKGEERQKKIDSDPETAYYSGRVLSSQFYIGSEFPKFFGRIEAIKNFETAAIKSSASSFTGALDE
jgi:hypothetical protein